ncbi:MAG: outer membrane lipoprotein-sorting protein [Elusimicrobia bacterium]|nr:outer membrane lipoprotein-sorting protein [Elusimicrobiota bacterium]
MKFFFLFLTAALSLPAIDGAVFAETASSAADLNLTAKEIVDRGQELLRGVTSSHARVAMRLVRPKFTREMEIESFNQGRDKSFIYIHRPPKEKGNRTLRAGQDIWTYTRDVERSVKIPFSMMHTSWMGSDFTYEDMTKLDSFVTDYTHKMAGQEKDARGRGDWLVTIELVPLADAPVVWGRVIWSAVVSQGGQEVIPVAEKDYSERGELVREILGEEIKVMGGKRIPTKIICRPLKKKGSETILEYKEMAFDEAVDPKIFTKEALERGLGFK